VLPRAGFISRMSLYLAEMHPVGPRLLAALLASTSFLTILGRIHGVPVTARVFLLGAASVFGLMLILRLMDELKDVAVDRALFPSRPLPSGRVLEEDIAFSLAVVIALYLSVHGGAGYAFGSAAAVLGYAFLMFHWFFVPDFMRPRLFFTLATHTPIIPLLLLHLLVIFAATRDMEPGQIRWASSLLLVGAYWALFFAWEISRKVRSREEEDAYVTYSRLLGPRGAVLLAFGAQSLAFCAGLHLVRMHGLCSALAVGLGSGCALALLGHVRFLLRPDRRTSRLGAFAEANIFCVLLGGCLA